MENHKFDTALDELLSNLNLSELRSHNPIAEIKKALRINLIFSAVFTLAFVVIIVLAKPIIVRILLTLIVFWCFWSLRKSYLLFKYLNDSIDPNASLLQELERQFNAINDWMNEQQKMALFYYPISIAAGFIYGGNEGSGKDPSEFMFQPSVMVILLISMAVLVPACFYLTRWMFNFSFGKHLVRLQANIKALKTED